MTTAEVSHPTPHSEPQSNQEEVLCLQCPNCGDYRYYHTYANGTTEEGYCQGCGHESRVPTTKKDEIPVINVERPKPKQARIKRQK